MPASDELEYFRSITLELQALRNRVRHFIKDAHWQTDGEWKESVLRSVFRRHLPQNIGVGSGFVITPEGPSTQIDILLYDRTKPLLYHDGDLVLVTADVCLGIIEVKTNLDSSQLREALIKLGDCHHFISYQRALCNPFVGLFSFEHDNDDHNVLLEALKTAAYGSGHRLTHCVALGTSLFARFWQSPPEGPRRPSRLFRAYRLHDMASAYFVHNVIEWLCERSVVDNNHIWYPSQGKEAYTLGQIFM